MVHVSVTQDYPSDGAGAGIGYSIRANTNIPSGTVIEVSPGVPLLGYLRQIPRDVDLQDWQLSVASNSTSKFLKCLKDSLSVLVFHLLYLSIKLTMMQ